MSFTHTFNLAGPGLRPSSPLLRPGCPIYLPGDTSSQGWADSRSPLCPDRRWVGVGWGTVEPQVRPAPPAVLLTDKEGRQLSPDEALDEAVPEYRAPGRKSLREIQQLDPEDESLAKYKRALLGPLLPLPDLSVPNVQVTRLTLMSEQAPGPITMDLTGELAALKDQVFVLKEGVDYKVKITFKVNKEIVSGLKCLHHTYRQGLRVDKAVCMLGSYGPSAQEYEFVTPVEEVPRGALVRGAYVVTSFFTDDDRTDHLSWEWGLHICQDWKS
ncbi:rho GDP-dissociation inhibitor 3 [Suricata suricatta]|uniref:rho GDP-dissociation inhibitor 3 n=1 Tax=Suricata suricatta TaxID=37032 RepID=UPI0011554D7D|nr:rho GDP-dissociation inhibitor 3 [Suricata suricatta]